MSDEPPRTPLSRNPSLIGGLAFLGGLAVALGAVELGGGFNRAPLLPAPAPSPLVQQQQQPQPSLPSLPPGTDIATLNAREAMLAGKLDVIELRLRDLDGSARAASTYATQAERLMIAFAARRAVERGQPLGALENQLRARFGSAQGDSVAAIIQAAAQPVTLEDLRLALETIASRLSTGPDDSLWDRARRMLGDMIVVRGADSPSPRPSDRLRRARRALVAGDVEAALAEVAHMPGAASAESWTSAAKRYLAARRALTEIEQAAMEMPAAQPAATTR
ncbi:MAG: hypothetical protein KF730_12775 [Sphingomonas sp.]|uniref:hypothetical protein n=1 Tax=Sphingomonas sp. TaxID=28214 RepID=UPI0025CDA25C|nr:hypothetical protein [Sphingomonas sp.]MBX3565436.1 hypothetical protein [Sphingomonas sp.]